jgi:hypothetical protein
MKVPPGLVTICWIRNVARTLVSAASRLVSTLFGCATPPIPGTVFDVVAHPGRAGSFESATMQFHDKNLASILRRVQIPVTTSAVGKRNLKSEGALT